MIYPWDSARNYYWLFNSKSKLTPNSLPIGGKLNRGRGYKFVLPSHTDYQPHWLTKHTQFPSAWASILLKCHISGAWIYSRIIQGLCYHLPSFHQVSTAHRQKLHTPTPMPKVIPHGKKKWIYECQGHQFWRVALDMSHRRHINHLTCRTIIRTKQINICRRSWVIVITYRGRDDKCISFLSSPKRTPYPQED